MYFHRKQLDLVWKSFDQIFSDRKPDDQQMQQLLKPTSDKISEIQVIFNCGPQNTFDSLPLYNWSYARVCTTTFILDLQAFREKSRRSDFFNHLSAIRFSRFCNNSFTLIFNHFSESVSALGWVVVAPTPAPYIKEMNDAGQFYTNRWARIQFQS